MSLEEQPCADLTVKLHMHFVVICFDMKTSAENININMSPFALCSYLLIIRQLLPHVTYHLFQSHLVPTHVFSKTPLFLSCVIFLLMTSSDWIHSSFLRMRITRLTSNLPDMSSQATQDIITAKSLTR